MSIAALILAAGSSSRLGSPKQLLPWGEGPLLQHVVGQIRSFGLEEIWWPDLGLVNRRDLDFLFPHDSEWIDWGM